MQGSLEIHGLSKAAADLDADGDLDLIVANEANGSITLAFGRGAQANENLAFEDIISYDLPSPFHRDPYYDPSLFTFDHNGDKAIDIGITFSTSSDIWVLTNIGHRSFAFERHEVVEFGSSSPLVFDYDSDGDDDLLLGGGVGGPSPSLRVLESQGGSHTYAPISADVEWSMVTGLSRIADSSVPHQNHVLATGTWAGAHGETPVWVYRVDSEGISAQSLAFSAGADPFGAFTHDLNGDGLHDAIIANRGSGDLSVALRSQGAGGAIAFESPARVPIVERGLCHDHACTEINDIGFGDFDGDGELEAIASLVRERGPVRLYTFELDGPGMRWLAQDAHSPVVADFNGDEVDDVVYSDVNGTQFLLSQP